FFIISPPPSSPLFPYTTLFRSLLVSYVGALVLVQLRDIHAVQQVASRSRTVQAAQDVHHGGLAGTRRTHDGYELPRMHFQIHVRSEEHTSELQSRSDLVCRLLL